MNTKIQKALIGGIGGTLAMSLAMIIAQTMGMPKMSPPEMLSTMMGFPILIGWLMHFMIGIVFALSYTIYFSKVLAKINHTLLKGSIFGFFVFIFAQISMAVIGAMMDGMPAMQGNMIVIILGSLMGHIIFGFVVSMLIVEKY